MLRGFLGWMLLLVTSCVSTPETPRALSQAEVSARILGRPLSLSETQILTAIQQMEVGFVRLRTERKYQRSAALNQLLARDRIATPMLHAALALEALARVVKSPPPPDSLSLWNEVCTALCSFPAVASSLSEIAPDGRAEWFRKRILTESWFALAGLPRGEWGRITPPTVEPASPAPKESISVFEAMKNAVKKRDFGAAKTLAERVGGAQAPAPCEPSWTYARFVDAQWARRMGKRNDFFLLQEKFASEVRKPECTASLFAMSEAEFAEFRADGLLWVGRLLWERGEDPLRALALAEEGRALAAAHGLNDILLEAAQLQIGRLGYENESPSKNLEMIESYAAIGNKGPQMAQWLDLRRGLFEWLDGQHEKAAIRFQEHASIRSEDPWAQAQAQFWRGRALAAGGWKEQSELAYKEAAQKDPLGYWDVVAGQALDSPSVHATSPNARSLLKGTYEDATQLLATGSGAKPHPFLGQIVSKQKTPANDRDSAPLWLLTSAALLAETRDTVNFSEALRRRNTLLAQMTYSESRQNALRLAEKSVSEEERARTSPALAWILHQAGDHLVSIPTADRARNRAGEGNPLADALLVMLYPRPFESDFREASRRCDVSENLLIALSRQESLFEPKAKSGAGALGLMQLLPSTARRIMVRFPEIEGRDGTELLWDPKANTLIGACYMADLLKRYNGNLVFAIAAYNAGENAVDGWVARRNRWNDPVLFTEFIPFAETQKYVQRVLRNYYNYQLIQPERPKS